MKKNWCIEEVSMSNDIDKTLEQIDKALTENAEVDWIPGAAPTQPTKCLALMLAPVDETPDFIEQCWRNIPNLNTLNIEMYFEAECQDCDWHQSRARLDMEIPVMAGHEYWASQHAQEHQHNVVVSYSSADYLHTGMLEGKPKTLWQKILHGFWNRSDTFWGTLNAICGGWAIFSLIIMKPQGFTAAMNWRSIGMCVTGFGIILWRKLKEK